MSRLSIAIFLSRFRLEALIIFVPGRVGAGMIGLVANMLVVGVTLLLLMSGRDSLGFFWASFAFTSSDSIGIVDAFGVVGEAVVRFLV